jgi:hypothetical protein
MADEKEILAGRWRALSEALAVVNQAGEEVTGKSTPQLMYFAGKDLGLKEASRLDQTDDIEQALAWVFPGSGEIWKITLWKNKDDDDFWVMEGDEMFIRLLFEHCPIRDSSLAAGVRLGGVTCQTVHGYAAGMLEKVFGRKVDLYTEHMGPGACLVALRTVME